MMKNPYEALANAFVNSVVAGDRGKITGNQTGLGDRLREYAFYCQERAKETGDAFLVNDLLDAARQLTRQAKRILELETQIKRAAESTSDVVHETISWEQLNMSDKHKDALRSIAALGSIDMAGEYEAGLRGIIRSMTDCARNALEDDRPEDRPHETDIRWAVNVLLETIAAKFEANPTFDLWRSDAAALVRSYKHKPDGSAR